jgi:hypothetical protein
VTGAALCFSQGSIAAKVAFRPAKELKEAV